MVLAILVAGSGCARAPGPEPGIRMEGTERVSIESDALVREAWTAFFGNRLADAERSFSLALEVDSRSDDAARGLALSRLLLGNEIEALDAVREMSRRPIETDHRNYLLPTICGATSTLFRENTGASIEYFRRLARAEAIGPSESRRVLRDLLLFYVSLGDVKSIQQTARDLHYVTLWSFLGPLENVAGSGHGRLAVTPAEPGAGESFRGKWGIPFRWSTPAPRYAPIDGNPDLKGYLAVATEATGYAVSTITSPEGGRALLSISHGGAISVFLNGVPIDFNDEYIKRAEEVHAEVHLLPGANQLFIEASGLESSADFAIGISELDGSSVKGLAFSGEISPAPEIPEDLREVRLREVPFLAAARKAWEENRSDPGALFWYLAALLEFGGEERIRQGLEEAGTARDSSAAVQLVRALLYETIGEPENMRSAWRAARMLSPACVPTGVMEAKDLLKRSRYGAAEKLLDELATRAPRSAEVRLARLSLFDRIGRKSGLEREASALVALHPELSEPYFRLMKHFEKAGDLIQRRKHRDLWVARIPKSIGLAFRVNDSLRQNDYPTALRDLEALSAITPDVPGYHVQRWFLELSMGNPRGLTELSALLGSFPYSEDALRQLATIRNALGETETARGLYRRLLEMRPFDFEVRNTLRSLEGKSPIEELLPPLGAEDSPAFKSPADSTSEEADAVVLVNAERRIVFADGANSKTKYFLAKVQTAKGVSRFGKTVLQEPFWTVEVEEAHTIKRSGERVEAEVLGNVVGFQSLVPGDFVEMRYRVPSFQAGALAREFWDEHFFQWDVPCLVSSYELLVPEDFRFAYKMHNVADPEACHSTRTLGEFAHHTWRMTNLPPFWTEANAPPLREQVPRLDVSSIESWGDVVDWYAAIGKWPSAPEERIRKKAEELVRGCSTRREEVRALFEFVRDEVRYDNAVFGARGVVPRKAKEVMRSGFGDCKDQAGLLISLLQAREIPASFVLTSTGEGRIPYLPSPRFTHATVLAEPDGERMLLDPTRTYEPFNSNSLPSRDTWSLPITAGAELSYSESGTSPARRDTVEIHGILQRDGVLRAAVRFVYTNPERLAEEKRRAAEMDPRDREEFFKMAIAGESPGLSVKEVSWEEGESRAVVRCSLECAAVPFGRSGQRTLRLPCLGIPKRELAHRTALETRATPLLLWEIAADWTERIEIVFSGGIIAPDLPQDLSISASGLIYDREVRARPGSLLCERRLLVPSTRVAPDDYPRFREIARSALADIESGLVVERR
jgi:tetratricopeptide (TPR) repeat protein